MPPCATSPDFVFSWEPTAPENQLYPKLLCELAEEFRDYARRGGQVFVSTHSPDFLNAAELEEVFWLVKQDGYTVIQHASDHATQNGGKPWKYLLIPHDAIAENMSIKGLAAQFCA